MEKKDFLLSSKNFFQEAVEEAFSKRNIKAFPAVQTYLVGILEHYLDARNLFEGPTLAEMYLTANQAAPHEKQSLLKKLGDRSLYVSGFFGDSLSRKLVDIDYYADMGGAAYSLLSDCVKEDTTAAVYRIYSQRFLEFVEVLTYISQKSMIQTDENLLRLYDRYVRTGSELAKEQLVEQGVLTLPSDQLKLGKQD
jgi:hypothetical protein